MRVLIGLLAISAFAETKPKPITPHEMIVAQSLMQAKAQTAKPFDDAFAEHQAAMCKARKIKPDACFVDWQHGTVGPKPKDAPKPPDATAK